jgi:hypothetical protein
LGCKLKIGELGQLTEFDGELEDLVEFDDEQQALPASSKIVPGGQSLDSSDNDTEGDSLFVDP